MDQDNTAKRKKNGQGSIYQLQNGNYGYAVTLGKDAETGKQKRKVIVGKTEEEVKIRMRTFLEDNGYIKKDKSCTKLRDFLRTYFEAYIYGKVNEDTAKDYKRRASYFEIVYGEFYVKDITKEDINKFLSINQYSENMYKKILATLKKIFEAAIEQEIITENPII